MRTALACLITSATLAACGDEQPNRRAAPDPRASAAALATRCGLVQPKPGRIAAVIPDGLLPPGSWIVQANRSGSSARATVLMPLGLNQALDHFARAAVATGRRVAFRENEVVEGEIYLSSDAGLMKFRIYASQRCADATQALFERTYLSD